MNILVLSWRDPKHPQAGGAEQVMHEHSMGWIKNGYQVTLLSSRFKGFTEKENLDGVDIIRKGDQYLGVKIAAVFYYLKNKDKFDFVIDQFHGIPFFTPFFVKKPKLAVLQEVTRKVWFLNGLQFPINYIVGVIGYLFEPFIFLFYKKTPFMVGSKSAKEDLYKMRIPAKNITIVSHGVIVRKPPKKVVRNKIKTVIYLGALAKDKGIEDAIKAFSILDKKGRYLFWVVGRGNEIYKNYLLALCDYLGLTGKVKFWGYVGIEKKFELLARAHLLVNPSAREGWGLVNVEANAMGVPVVAYKSAGLIDSVKDGINGLICQKNTPQKMSVAVISILDNPILYMKLSVRAEKWSKNFSWEKSCKQSLKLLGEVKNNKY